VSDYKFSLEDDSVAVIIGSGAGGGTLANQLAQQGIDVVCLEAGRRLAPADIVNDEAAMFPKFTWLDEVIGEGDALPNFPLWICKTVGGTTMHWTAATPRLQAHEMRALSTYGEITGASLVDWPISLADLEPYYARAERMMGVTGTNGIPMLPGNNNFKVLEAGGRKLGYTDIDTNRMAINPEPRDGRGGCLQLGFCTSGCATQAKWCTLYTQIRDAEQTDHFELRPESMVMKILHEGDRVTAVQYLDTEGQMHEQKARFICVAGNAPGTARLLLNSASTHFPEGLANTSDQVGRNYMRHMLAAVVGIMPGEVHIYKGPQVAGVIRDETRHDPARGFSGGFQMHTVGLSPGSLADLMLQGKWGHEFTSVLEKYRNYATVMIMGEDLPTADNRISLHPERRDQYGLPVPVVHYTNHPNNRAMLHYGLEQCNKLYRSLGAEQVFDLKDVFPATHNMGTARMGEDPATSVTNPWGQTHDIGNLFISDGSLFPTAGCENPTLTIVTLVLRQAEYIQQQMQRGAI